MTKFKDLDYDAIVMPGYYTETGIITKQARDLGIDKPILGPDGFSDAKFTELAGKKECFKRLLCIRIFNKCCSF